MYKIIGANNAEYGPASVEQLRQWISEGRINAQTMAQAVGETDWKPISTFADFTASFPSPNAPPLASGTPPTLGAAPTASGSRAAALSEVGGPAIGLIITGALGMLNGVLNVFGNVLGTVFGFRNFGMNEFNNIPAQNMQFIRSMQHMSGTLGIFSGILYLALGALIIYGGLKMKALERYSLCLTVSILALVPCISPCCCVGLPIGIWALVVLNKPEVRDYFS